ncbi:MAG: hypothetical protein RBJ76_02330 [Stenomitos frigidus ULC029]
MEAEQAENVPPSPLLQRLAHRHTQPGVINLSRYSSESTGLPGWIVQRSTLVEQLQTRYSSRDADSTGSTELALATASPAPVESIARSPLVTPVGAIAPSTPLVTKAPVPSEPLPLSHSATVIAPSPSVESEPATVIAAPEPIASFNASNESIGEGAIARTASSQQYRLRRVSANPTTPLDTIQRKLVDESSTAIVPVAPVPSFHETALIVPEAATPASIDTPSSVDLATPALEPIASPMPIAPSNALQPGVNTAQTTVIFRYPLSNALPTEGRDVTIAPPPLPSAQPASVVSMARPLMQSTTIVQRSADTHPSSKAAGFSPQLPAAMASAPSISALPLQPSLIWRREDAVTNGLVRRRSQPELPLAISTGSVVPPTIALQTEPTSTASIDAGSSPSSALSPPPTPMPSSGVPVGKIAEQVSRILFRQLTVERERRGMSQWS